MMTSLYLFVILGSVGFLLFVSLDLLTNIWDENRRIVRWMLKLGTIWLFLPSFLVAHWIYDEQHFGSDYGSRWSLFFWRSVTISLLLWTLSSPRLLRRWSQIRAPLVDWTKSLGMEASRFHGFSRRMKLRLLMEELPWMSLWIVTEVQVFRLISDGPWSEPLATRVWIALRTGDADGSSLLFVYVMIIFLLWRLGQWMLARTHHWRGAQVLAPLRSGAAVISPGFAQKKFNYLIFNKLVKMLGYVLLVFPSVLFFWKMISTIGNFFDVYDTPVDFWSSANLSASLCLGVAISVGALFLVLSGEWFEFFAKCRERAHGVSKMFWLFRVQEVFFIILLTIPLVAFALLAFVFIRHVGASFDFGFDPAGLWIFGYVFIVSIHYWPWLRLLVRRSSDIQDDRGLHWGLSLGLSRVLIWRRSIGRSLWRALPFLAGLPLIWSLQEVNAAGLLLPLSVRTLAMQALDGALRYDFGLLQTSSMIFGGAACVGVLLVGSRWFEDVEN